MNKPNIIVFLKVIAILGSIFFILAALVSYRKSLENREVLIDCFASFASVKCGAVDDTEKEIEREITGTLKLSPKEAREIILKEKKKAEDSLAKLNQKNVLTEYEKRVKKEMEDDLMPYYERVLKVIDSMEK